MKAKSLEINSWFARFKAQDSKNKANKILGVVYLPFLGVLGLQFIEGYLY